MTLRPTDEQELQTQIEASTEGLFSTTDIEERIARALLTEGEFHENISPTDLEVILRNIVYVMFAHQKVAGRDIDILHNIPIINVEIEDGQANVDFVVHIHKPIIVFLEFKYVLINQEGLGTGSLCLKDGSLRINERTRRFDVKAKAALTAMNVPKIAQQEMSDLKSVIKRTLPNQLRKKGVTGEISDIRLSLNEHSLRVRLTGDFLPLVDPIQQSL